MKKRLEFMYDHMSRRVEKKVLSGYSACTYATTGNSTTWGLDAETGFYYYGRRYYDPESGRWVSLDPI
ncbi:MAG: hypothetical protein C0404_12110 [Verrucomicrobia bacterium]|nr:hypothetical protein [Verrucomicrobiota bacterium]